MLTMMAVSVLEWIMVLLDQNSLCRLCGVSKELKQQGTDVWLRRGLELQHISTRGCTHLHMPVYQQLRKIVQQKRFKYINILSLRGMDLAAVSKTEDPLVLQLVLSRWKHIRSLDLRDTFGAYAYSCEAVVERAIGRSCPSLTSLAIPTGGASSKGLRAIMQGCTMLEELALFNEDGGYAPRLSGGKWLRSLRFEMLQHFRVVGCRDIEIIGFEAVLCGCAKLKSLEMRLKRGQHPKIRKGAQHTRDSQFARLASLCPSSLSLICVDEVLGISTSAHSMSAALSL